MAIHGAKGVTKKQPNGMTGSDAEIAERFIRTYRRLPFGKKHYRIRDWDALRNAFAPFCDLESLRKKYKNLVLQIDGGGIKGVMDAFAFYVLDDLHDGPDGRITRNVDTFYGTSTGSILAAVLAAGISTKEILRFYIEEGPRIFTRRFLWPILSRDEFDPSRLLVLLKRFLGRTTFAELRDGRTSTNGRDGAAGRNGAAGRRAAGKRLTIVVCDALTRGTVFCSSETTPDMPIADAVMGSTCVPLIFPPHVFSYTDRAGRRHDCAFYDGFIGGLASAADRAAEDSFARWGRRPGRFAILSFGTGTSHPALTPKRVRTYPFMNLMNWTLGGLLAGMIEIQMGELEEYRKIEGLTYLRWDVRLPEGLDMSDEKTDLIRELIVQAMRNSHRRVKL